DVEDVIRLAVRASPFQEPQIEVECLDQSYLICELMHGTDATTRDRMIAFCDLVVDRASAELGSARATVLATLCRWPARCDLGYCRCELPPDLLFHLKASACFWLRR